MPWWRYEAVEELVKDLERLASEEWREEMKKRYKEVAEKVLEFQKRFFPERTHTLLGYALIYRYSSKPQLPRRLLDVNIKALVAWGEYDVFVDAIDVEEWLEKYKHDP